jgi:sugar phosphate isomerase/epimerase
MTTQAPLTSTTIGLQLYTIRDEMEKDFEGAMRRLSVMGYRAVEIACIPAAYSPAQAMKIFQRYDLTVISVHTNLPIGNNTQAVLDEMGAYNCRRVVSGMGGDDMVHPNAMNAAIARWSEAVDVGLSHGLSLHIHNHWWEFGADGSLYDTLIQKLPRHVALEIDVYWTQTAGVNPASVVKKYAARAPLLHIKDGPAVIGKPMTAVGSGTLDIPAIVTAGRNTTAHFIVEMDACATDMMDAVKQSYDYLSGVLAR